MSDPAPKHDPFAALRNPEFRSFIGVRFFTTFALTMQFTALAWTVFKTTHSTLVLGGLGLAEFLPVVLLALPVGGWVEQLEKRRVLLAGLFVALLGSLAITALSVPALHGRLPQGALIAAFFGVVALGGVVRAFFAPTFFSLIGSIVPAGQTTNSATWTASAFLAAQVAGPVAGGLLLHHLGAVGAQACVNGLLVVALAFGARLRQHPPLSHTTPAQAGERTRDRLLLGLKFVWNNPYILGASVLDLLAVLFGDAVPLLPAFVKNVLGGDEQAYGILRAMPGLGSCAMIMLLAKFPPRKGAGKTLLGVVFAYGLGMVAFGFCRSFALTLVLLLACGALDGVSVVIRQSILQLHTPAHMRGRVGSVNSIFISSSNELGTFVSGGMAAALGLVPAIVTGGVFILALTGATALFNPTLRKMDLEEKK